MGRVIDIVGEIQKSTVSKQMITQFFQGIIENSQAEMITYNSIREYKVEQEIGIRCAGFVRPFGNRVCPLTQIINLQSDRNCNRNWKRNLKKAVDNGLIYEVIDRPTEQDADTVCRLFDELKQRKSLAFSLNKEKVTNLLKQPEYSLHYVVRENSVLCARIIYSHEGQAADVFAANSFEAMKYSATHFIMEQVFAWLKENGMETFDFSRISPSAYETNTIYQFKEAAGGYPVQYLGEWIWTRKHRTLLLFCIYNFFIHRKHSY